MELNIERFLSTLPIMLKGMVGIFAVAAVLILSAWVLSKVTAKKPESRENDQ